MGKQRRKIERRKIALALQGGGAHGAFTWGVLDHLLQEPELDIIGVTGTSAGAMNAVVLADGLLRGGAEEARRRLRMFWESVGSMPGFGSLLWPLSGSEAAAVHLEQTPPYLAWDLVARNLSPYQLNPTNQNPLRAPLEALVDFKRLRAQKTSRSWFARPTCAPRGGARLRMPTSRPTPFSHRPACRTFFLPCRSTARRTGTAAIRETLH
jgi:NTE family protein